MSKLKKAFSYFRTELYPIMYLQREILADILKMEEKEQFRKEMMQRLIPERDTNTETQEPERRGQRGRPTVAQTRTSGLRSRTGGVEPKVNTGLRKSAWQKENIPLKATVRVFTLFHWKML